MKKFLEVLAAIILTILALPAIVLASICVGILGVASFIVESLDNMF